LPPDSFLSHFFIIFNNWLNTCVLHSIFLKSTYLLV